MVMIVAAGLLLIDLVVTLTVFKVQDRAFEALMEKARHAGLEYALLRSLRYSDHSVSVEEAVATFKRNVEDEKNRRGDR